MSDELPPGWALTDIGTLGRYVNGRGFGKDEWKKVGLPIIRIQNLNDEHAEFNYSDQEHEAKYRVNDGDLLVSWAASLGVYYWNRGPAWLNQHIFRVEVEERAVTKPFLYYTLKHALEGLYKKAHGSGMVHVTKGKFDSHPVKLPPLNEQQRIVSKIDELFSRIDEGERALDRVATLVERYRQSVLKAAVTGELTLDWREKNQHSLESGEALLARILKARREAWEKAELDRMKAKGITPANDKWKQKYDEPAAPNIEDLPDLPSGWAWASLDQLTSKITSGSRDWKDFYGRGESVFVMAQNVRPRRLDLAEIQLVDPPPGDRDAERSEVRQHDLLVTIVGANTGDVCRVREPLSRHYVCQSVALARPVIRDISEFLELFLCASEGGQAEFAKVIYGAGRPHLSFDQLKATPIPVPPIAEQIAARDAVDLIESEIDSIKRGIGVSTKSASALRQSVLRSAFSGLLVVHDVSDEPASHLLQRIAAERSEAPAKPKRGRKPKTSQPA